MTQLSYNNIKCTYQLNKPRNSIKMVHKYLDIK